MTHSLAIIATILLLATTGAHAAEEAKKGTVTTEMRSVSAVQQNGSPDPSKDGACQTKFGPLVGVKAVSNYDINAKTGMMKAQTIFEKQTYDQHPLGIYGKYAFGVYFNPVRQPLGVYGALFSISYQYDKPVTTFILTLDATTNCVVSSAGRPLEEAESIRFGGAAR